MKLIKLVIFATKFYWSSSFSGPLSSGSAGLGCLPTTDGLVEAPPAAGGFSPTVLDLVCLTLAAAVAVCLFFAMKLVLGFDNALVDGGISCLYTLGEAGGLVWESCRLIEPSFLVCLAELKAIEDFADGRR